MSDLTILSPIADYIAAHPVAARIFADNKLDWQATLDQPLEIACTSQGVDLSLLLMDLIEATASEHTQTRSCSL